MPRPPEEQEKGYINYDHYRIPDKEPREIEVGRGEPASVREFDSPDGKHYRPAEQQKAPDGQPCLLSIERFEKYGWPARERTLLVASVHVYKTISGCSLFNAFGVAQRWNSLAPGQGRPTSNRSVIPASSEVIWFGLSFIFPRLPGH